MLKIVVLVIAALTLLIWQVWPMIYQASVTSMWSIGEGTTQQISLSDMKKIESSEGTVYFKPEQEQLAKALAEILNSAHQLIQERLGVYPKPLSVVLIPKQAGIGTVILEGVAAVPILIPSSMKSLRDADAITDLFVYWVVPHESVELVIAPILYHDRSSRWIGDGLAQYASYLVAQEFSSQAFVIAIQAEHHRVNALLAQGITLYDLMKDFLVIKGRPENLLLSDDSKESAGYAVSLAFWLDITKRHGDEVIRAFWREVNQLQSCLIPYVLCLRRPTAGDAVRILSRLTGEDIGARLRAMDLQEVLKILDSARL